MEKDLRALAAAFEIDTDDSDGAEALHAETISAILPQRPKTAHKGTFGHAVIVGGSAQYRGAPALAARAAARAGVGTVAIAAPETITDSIAPIAPEATHIPLTLHPDHGSDGAVEQIAASFQTKMPNALCIGPGLGRSAESDGLIRVVLQRLPASTPIVVDADALNAMAEWGDWPKSLRRPAVITPHPGEMARLCGMDGEDIQANRVGLAQQKATEWRVTVVLKGAYTVVASPDALPAFCPLAMPALASGGTGDALAGIITAFLAQGLSTDNAARAGVYVHGMAAVLAARGNGNMASGLLASDLIERIPEAMALIHEQHQSI